MIHEHKKGLPRLLFIGQLPPPMHGVTLMNSYVVKSELIRSNFNVDSIGLHFGQSLDELSGFSFKKVFRSLRYLVLIAWRVLKNRPDLVYFTLVPTGFAFYRDAGYVFLMKAFRLRMALHLHGKGVEKAAAAGTFKKALYRRVFHGTHVICLSENVATDIASVYRPKPFIVPNGIEVQAPFRRPEKPHGIVQILYLSNYIREKGVLVLIEALGMLRTKGYTFHARFVGAPFDLTIDNLKEQVRMHNLEGYADIVGPRLGDEKLGEYKNADLFVFPTCFEAFGLVAVEAMQYSLPVVATFEGSLPNIVCDNETGFLVQKRDPQMLAEKIAVLLGDAPLRRDMGTRGRQRFLEHFTLDQFERNINATLLAILGRREQVHAGGMQAPAATPATELS